MQSSPLKILSPNEVKAYKSTHCKVTPDLLSLKIYWPYRVPPVPLTRHCRRDEHLRIT